MYKNGNSDISIMVNKIQHTIIHDTDQVKNVNYMHRNILE